LQISFVSLYSCLYSLFIFKIYLILDFLNFVISIQAYGLPVVPDNLTYFSSKSDFDNLSKFMVLEIFTNGRFLEIVRIFEAAEHKGVASNSGTFLIKTTDRSVGPNFKYGQVDYKEPCV